MDRLEDLGGLHTGETHVELKHGEYSNIPSNMRQIQTLFINVCVFSRTFLSGLMDSCI